MECAIIFSLLHSLRLENKPFTSAKYFGENNDFFFKSMGKLLINEENASPKIFNRTSFIKDTIQGL